MKAELNLGAQRSTICRCCARVYWNVDLRQILRYNPDSDRPTGAAGASSRVALLCPIRRRGRAIGRVSSARLGAGRLRSAQVDSGRVGSARVARAAVRLPPGREATVRPLSRDVPLAAGRVGSRKRPCGCLRDGKQPLDRFREMCRSPRVASGRESGRVAASGTGSNR